MSDENIMTEETTADAVVTEAVETEPAQEEPAGGPLTEEEPAGPLTEEGSVRPLTQEELPGEEPAGPLTEEQLAEAFEKEAEKVPQEQSIFKDANGGFNWGLLAVILAFAMFLVAIVWLLSKAIKVFGSALLIILAAGVIVYTIFHIRE